MPSTFAWLDHSEQQRRKVLDPLHLFKEQGTVDELGLGTIRDAFADMLFPGTSAPQTGDVKEAWYWAAPILLDLHRHPAMARRWLLQAALADVWRSSDEYSVDAIGEDEDGVEDAWTAHVAEAQRLVNGRFDLGRPPADLARVLATVALGGPGVLALRALSRISGGSGAFTDPRLRNEAGWIAWGLRTLFNLPDVASLVRSLNADEPYWLRVAEYCAFGGLQAVLDEYAHVLLEHQGVAHRNPTEATRVVAEPPPPLRIVHRHVDADHVTDARHLTVAVPLGRRVAIDVDIVDV